MEATAGTHCGLLREALQIMSLSTFVCERERGGRAREIASESVREKQRGGRARERVRECVRETQRGEGVSPSPS